MFLGILDLSWELVLGPLGALVISLIVNVVLWRKMNREQAETTAEIKELNKDRNSDLVSGMKYRENINEKLLLDNIEDRATSDKLINAVNSMAEKQGEANGDLRLVKEVVEETRTIIKQKSN